MRKNLSDGVLVGASDVTITPPFVPVRSLSYFRKNVRRVYLSATLAAPDAFTRTFGAIPDPIIAPQTTAGECERLILIPSLLDRAKSDVDSAKQLIRKRKALILVPTYQRAKQWDGTASFPVKERVTETVNQFKTDKGAPKLLLAARYDGVDLPGDTCRVLVIDDLPMGVGPLERYLWEQLNVATTLRSTIASRIVQSFGRISRGMSDHGVVLITSKRLVDWILVPRNAATLPAFLQKQLSLGYEISHTAEKIGEFDDAIDKCLDRSKEWTAAYNSYMESAEAESFSEDKDRLKQIAQSEADFMSHLWSRDLKPAIRCLSSTLETAFDISASTGAWHALWLGRTYELAGENKLALEMYSRARASHKAIPPLLSEINATTQNLVPPQILEVERQINVNADGTIRIPSKLDADLAHLDGTGTHAQVEESIRALGQYLGLSASRPDNEHGTGPDVLWESPGQPALCIEVKTDKKPGTAYRKEDLGQLSDHIQWVKDNTEAKKIVPIFVGPVAPCTDTANPPTEFMVVDLNELYALGQKLSAALRDVAANSLPITLRPTLIDTFKKRNLNWPSCFDDLKSHQLRGLSKTK